MSKTVRIFLASSIVAFARERITIGAFVERMIQAYRLNGVYFKLYRCEDETFAFVEKGAQEYLNDMVAESDYAVVLVRDSLGEATIDEIRRARETKPELLFFVLQTSPKHHSEPWNTVRKALSVADAGDLLDCATEDNCFGFSNPAEVCSRLLRKLVSDAKIDSPEWIVSPDGKHWLSHDGYALIREDEIENRDCWDCIADTRSGGILTNDDVRRVFVVTAPDGVDDGNDMLNFVRVLNDIYQSLGMEFEAFSFTSDMLDPNATDEVASDSTLFLVLARKNGDADADAMLRSTIEAYRDHLDEDGDGFPKILTFFEDVEPLPDVLARMQENLREIGHYYSLFENIDSVKFMVAVELARLLAADDLYFQRGRLRAKGGAFDIDLRRVPIFKNHAMLESSIKELERIEAQIVHAHEPGDVERDKELEHAMTMLQDVINSIETDLLTSAKTVAELWSGGDLKSLEKRQQERVLLVKRLFDEGRYNEVIDALTTDDFSREVSDEIQEIKRDNERHRAVIDRARHMVNMELVLVSAIRLRGMTDDDMETVVSAFERCIELSKEARLDFSFMEQYVQLLWHREQRPKAIDACKRVLSFFEEEGKRDRREPGRSQTPYRLERARTSRQLADVMDNSSDVSVREEAVRIAERALRVQMRAIEDLEFDDEPRSEELEMECAKTRNSLGVYHTHLGLHETSLARKGAEEGDVEEVELHRQCANKHFNKALDYHEKALSTFEEWEANGVNDHREILGKAYNNVATDLVNLGRFEEALPYHERSLELRRADDSVGPVDKEHYVANSLNSLATGYFKLAMKQAKDGDTASALKNYAEAERHHREALEIREKYEGDNRKQFAPRLAASRHNLAGCIIRQVKLDEDMTEDDRSRRLSEAHDLLELACEVRSEFASTDPAMYGRVANESKDLLDECSEMQGL